MSGVLAAVAVVGCVLAACDDDAPEPAASTTLYRVGTDHAVCAPSEKTDTFTVGFDTFANRGPGLVTIDRVDWPTEGDLAVDSIRVFQRQPGDLFATLGIWDGLPQDKLTGSERRAWERAAPAEGADVEFADPDEGYLVFVIGVRGAEGSGGPLTLHFTDGDGAEGTATSEVVLEVRPRCGSESGAGKGG